MKFPRSSRSRNVSDSWLAKASLLLLGGSTLVAGIDIDMESQASIKKAAAIVAKDLRSEYTGDRLGDVPGNLPDPYYWWEAGAMFGTLVEYWYYTKDDTYNKITTQALLFQVGPDNDYMPPNQTKTEGNDDQAFWAMAAMTAAEVKFPDPPADEPQWLALAQAVFNRQVAEWDDVHCNGGLRWQIFSFNTGYDYKNTISNGCFFNLAARLALYTGNQTYADWADKTWDWITATNMISADYHFFDGAHTTMNCSDINRVQWTYNVGVFLMGASSMYNYSEGAEQEVWRNRIEGMLNGTDLFFTQPPKGPKDVMIEQACEPFGTCNTDNYSFKAYLSRWLAATTKLAPFTSSFILPKLKASAAAAAAQCVGGESGTKCGMIWTEPGKYDGTMGVGQSMSALSVIQANLITEAPSIVSASRGGTSKGDVTAGTGQSGRGRDGAPLPGPITGKDRAGAGILTALALIGVVGGCWWMVS